MLKVECESCKAPYQVDERRVPQTGLKMRCPKCGHTFLVTDPSKSGGAGTGAKGGAKAAHKATMMGFGVPGAPPPTGAKPVAPAPKPPPPRVAPKVVPKVVPKPAPAKPAIPALDDLDLPAVAGDVGLPAPAAPKDPAPTAGAPKRPPPAPASPGGFGFELDLPSVPSDGGGAFGSIDLPTPAGGSVRGGFGDIDLPSPAAAKGGFGDVDLPTPKGGGFGDLDLPAAKGTGFGDLDLPAAKGGGFGDLDLPEVKTGGFADLPSPQDVLPVVGGAALPSPKRGGGGGGFGEIDLPSLQNDLPEAAAGAPTSGDLPSPMAPAAHLPTAVSDDRLLPDQRSVGPSPVSFGELDLPLVDGPGPEPVPATGGPGARIADPVSFGELDLPPDPGGMAPPGAEMHLQSGGHAPASGMGFGEVDLGGSDLGPVAAPPPATSAGTFAFQEASLESAQAPAPAKQRPPAPEQRAPSKAPKILGLVVALVVVGGAALQFTPVGAFGHVFISEMVHKGDYEKSAAAAGDAARSDLAADTFASAEKVGEDLSAARNKWPRSKPLATTAAFYEYLSQVRFGADPARAARAKTFLADIAPKDEVPYFFSALAAEAGAEGDWAKAKQLLDTAAAKDPKDGIRQDQAILRGEIALAEKDAAGATSAFTEARSMAPTARASFGLARAYYLTRDYGKAKEADDATLEASPRHIGALTLRAQLTWDLKRDAEAALKDLGAVLADDARKKEGSAEVSQALAVKGWIMHARDRATEARASFDEAVKINPRNVSALVGQGEVLYSDGRFTEALTRFDEASSKDPTSVAAVIGSAKTKIALERLADAKNELTQARAKWPKEMGIALWLAKAEEALGNPKVAEELYGDAVDLVDPANPESIEAYAALARFLAAQGKASQAQAKLDEARSKLPDSPALQRAFGDVAAAEGQNEAAIEHYQAALEKNPADLGTRFRLGVTYRKVNELEKAAEEFDKVVAIDKDYPGIALERGALFEASGEMDKALEQFSAAYQKAPNDADLKLRIGAAYVTIGDTDKAIPLLKQVYEQRPNSAEANHFLGRAYLRQGGLEQAAAMRYLQRAVDLDPNKAEYHLYVAWAANEASPAQLGLARKHVDKALALDQLLADAYWQRGVVELREGALAAAVKDLKKALELKPSRHEAHAALAETYEQKNDTSAALSEWAKAIAGDDKRPTWRYRYGRLLADKRRTAEAAKHLAFAVEHGKGMQPRPGWLARAAFDAGEALRKTGQKSEACDAYKLFLELSESNHPDRKTAVKGMAESGCAPED